jgi:Na+-transporting methylmalonyl-CoA/oxaloacetate decarboxylase gamma subunit
MTDTESALGAKKKKGCGFWILVAVGVIIVLSVIGSFLPKPTPEQEAAMAAEKAKGEAAAAATEANAAKAKRDSATKVSANELFNAYQANEMAAQKQYSDKLLEVSGTVSGVALDILDKPVVSLSTSNQFMSVSVYLTEATQSQAADYSKGQKITVVCEEISELASMPQLKECVPVK